MNAAVAYAASTIAFAGIAARALPASKLVSPGSLSIWVAALAAVGIGGAARLDDVMTGIGAAYIAVAAATDIASGFILDTTGVAAAVALAAVAAFAHSLAAACAGGIAAVVPMLAMYAATRGRGMGLGDVKAAAVIGMALGPWPAMEMLGVAFVFGAIWSCVRLIGGQARRRDAVAFAPFLAAGTMAVCFAGGVPNG